MGKEEGTKNLQAYPVGQAAPGESQAQAPDPAPAADDEVGRRDEIHGRAVRNGSGGPAERVQLQRSGRNGSIPAGVPHEKRGRDNPDGLYLRGL